MTTKQFSSLGPGDVVRHKVSSAPYIVHANYGKYVTAVTVKDLTNPDEWDLVSKCQHRRPPTPRKDT